MYFLNEALVQLCMIYLQVVFGEVVDGMDTVKKIEALGSQSGRTQKKITIADSGEVASDKTQK